MKKIILAFFTLMLFVACKKEKNTTDPRMAFMGEYQSRGYTFHLRIQDGIYVDDTTIAVSPGSPMHVGASEDSAGGVEMDMTAFVDDAATAIYSDYSVPFSISFDKDVLAQTSGNEITFESAAFEHTHLGKTLPGSISGQGTLNGNILTLEYEIELMMQESPTRIIFNLYGELEFVK